MQSTPRFLAALSERFSPGEMAQVVGRLLRMPAVWPALRDLEIDQIPGGMRHEPVHLFMGLLGLDIEQIEAGNVDPGLRGRAVEAFQTIMQGQAPPTVPEDLALAALGMILARRENQLTTSVLAERIRNNPTDWHNLISVAFPLIQDQAALFAAVLKSPGSEPLRLAVDSHLANLEGAEVAAALLQIDTVSPVAMLTYLQDSGEAQLAQSYAEQLLSRPAEKHGMERRLEDAAARAVIGEPSEAAAELEQIWEESAEFTGALADRLAGHSSQHGSALIELEARMQALQARPTAERRAEAALSLANAGRLSDAEDLIRHPNTPADWIAKGILSQLQDETEQSRDSFLHAAEDIEEAFRWSGRWIARLENGLWQTEEIAAAIELIRWDLARRSSSPRRLARAAKRFRESGYTTEALEWGQTALTLSPQEPEIKQILAECMCASNDPQGALPYWQDLAITDPLHILPLARCALDAQDLELAQDAIDRVLAEQPADPEARSLLSRTLASRGERSHAMAILEELLDEFPDFAPAWIEKAIQILDAGDLEKAGETLRRAAQISPKNADIYHILSDWDRSQGHLSEAQAWITRALELDPKNSKFLRTKGEILLALGHTDQAYTAIRSAHRLQPGDWKIRFRLAELLEKDDRLDEAAELLSLIPPYASVECYIAAGRIRVRAASHPEEAALAVEALETAQARGSSDSMLHLWLGRAYELEGSDEKAFEAYRSYMEQGTDAVSREQAALGMARTALAQGKSEAALSILQPLVEEFSESVDLQLALSTAYEENGLLEKALDAARTAATLAPASLTSLQRLADIASKAGSREDATAAWDQLSASNTPDPGAWILLASIAADLSDVMRLRTALARAVWCGRQEAGILTQAGEACASQGWMATSQRLLARACQLNGGDPDLLARLAQVSARAGNLEISESAWRTCTEIQPDRADHWVGYAETLWSLEQRSRAIGAWQRALALDPTAEIHIALARAHSASQELELALAHYRDAIAIHPESAAVTLEAGRTALQAGQAESAVKWLQQSAKAHPDRWEPFVGLGEALMALGRIAAATRALKHAVGQAGAGVQAHALLAKAYLASGRIPAARSAFEQATSKAVRSTLDRILVSDVALQLGEWEHALAAVQAQTQTTQDDPRLDAQALRVQVRTQAARWLFVDCAEAHEHGPAVQDISPEILQELNRLSHVTGVDSHLLGLERLALEAPNDLPIVKEIRTALTQRPDAETVEGLTIGLLRAGRAVEAAELVQLAPSGQWRDLLHGLSLERTGQLDEALKAYELAEENLLVRPLALALGAKLAAREGWVLEALSRWQRAVTLWPDEAAWQRALAEQYMGQDAFDAALAHAQQAAERNPADAQALILLARLQRKLGDLTAARSTYGSVIQLLPQRAEIWREAGEVAFRVGEAEQALGWYERAAALNPDDPVSLAGAAQANMALGQIDAASGFIRSALRLAPQDPDVLNTLASVLARQGKHERALEAAAEAVRVSDRRDDIVRARFHLLLDAGRTGEAADEAERLVESCPDDEGAWSCLALALEAEGEYERASDAAAQAAALAPRSLECRLTLGRLLRKSGQLDRALDELTQAQESSPDDWRPLQELAQVYEARRQPKVALELYARITEQRTDAKEALLRGGLLLKELKAYPEAARWLERAVELDPRNADAHHQLAAVRALELVHGGFGRLVGAR